MAKVRLPRIILFSTIAFVGTAAPLAAQEVPWRYDYLAARKEAKEKNKPLVLDFGTADCHWCKKLDLTTFRDPAVVKALTERFIPVKIDGEKEAGLANDLGISSYPTLVYAAPNGKILGQQDGYVEAAKFGQQLERLLADSARLAKPAVASNETSVPPADRGRRAKDLLARAQEAYKGQNDAGCLEHCKALTTGYADLPEAAEAERLASRIKNDPERLAQACEKLADALGSTYLELAESLLRKGQTQQALAYLEKTLRSCPGTHAAQLAQERLFEVRDQASRPPDGKGVVRSQMP